MDTYLYLMLASSVMCVLGLLLLWRKDMLRVALKTGIVGGSAGLVSELFYFRDYWRPPTVVGIAKISPEDFIFGFGITALSVVIYPVLLRRRLIKIEAKKQYRSFLILFLGGLAGMLIFNLVVGINSIFVSSSIFVILSLFVWYKRRDLIAPSICSSLLVTGIIFFVYFILFVVISPHYFPTYWLLGNHPAGLTIFNGIPLTELMWYFSWSLLASCLLPFVNSERFEAITREKDTEK